MCAVSAVHGQMIGIPPQQWSWPIYDQYSRTVKTAETLDEMLGLKDCGNEAKEKFMAEIEAALVKKYGLRTEQEKAFS